MEWSTMLAHTDLGKAKMNLTEGTNQALKFEVLR